MCAMEKIEAVVFDMDGILLDTETICDKTWEMALDKMGVKSEVDIVNECRGMNREDSVLTLKKIIGQDFDGERFLSLTSDYFHEVEFSTGIPLMPYAKEILEYLRPKYKLALASSTHESAVMRQMKNAGLIGFFDKIITGDKVTHSKPNPEIYQMACKAIETDCNKCVAIEDSPNGIRSAHAAGMNVIMIPDKIKPTKEIEEKCWKIFDTLEGVKTVL